jgi:hypothetical protein
VLLSFHHNHLPKLEDLGFADANLDRYSVTTDPRSKTAIWGSGETNSLVVVLKAIFV